MAFTESAPQPWSSPFSSKVDCKALVAAFIMSRERAGSAPKAAVFLPQRGSTATSVWGPRSVVMPRARYSMESSLYASVASSGVKLAASARLSG